MSRFYRILIIALNLTVLPISLLISFIMASIYYIKECRDLLTIRECLGIYVMGIKEGIQRNKRFWRTGDLKEFD